MKQIEVTLKVNNTLKEVDDILTKKGFKIIRKSRIEDKYMLNNKEKVSENNILEILKKCVLLRYLNVNNENEYKRITYKNKKYKDNIVISEEKINVMIDDIEKSEALFNAIGYEKLVEVNYDVIVYEKDGLEFAFQDVENFGLLVEYENIKDFEGKSSDEIIVEKANMKKEIESNGIKVGEDFDVKKAYELILKQL